MLAAARRHAERTGGATSTPTCSPPSGPPATRVVADERALDGVRAGGRPLAVRGARRAAPAGAGPPGARPTPSGTPSAPLYLDVLRRFDGLFDLPMPYIAAWHQAPVRVDRDLGYLHLQLFSIRRAPRTS